MKNDFARFNEMADLNSMSASSQEGIVLMLDPEEILILPQVRKVFKGIEELAESMKVEQIEPIVVSPLDKNTNKYTLQKGERRVRAGKIIGNGYKLKAIVDSTPRTGAEAIASQMRENLFREDFTPIETAQGLVELRKVMQEAGMKGSGRDLALALNKPESWISKHLDLADIPEALTELCTDEITSDADLIQSLKKIHELDLDLFGKLVAKARTEEGLGRAEARQALKNIRSGASVRTEQNPGEAGTGSNASDISEQSSQKVDPKAGQGGTAQSESHKGAIDEKQDANLEANSGGGAPNILHAETSGSGGGQQDIPPELPASSSTKSASKKLGKNDVMEIAAAEMVMQVRVSLDKRHVTGELLLNVITGNPHKGMVSYLDGGKQNRALFDLDRIEIVSLARLAAGD